MEALILTLSSSQPFSPAALAAITRAGYRRTYQMQELHIDQGFMLSHVFPIAGFKMNGGRAHHPSSDGQESMSSQLSLSNT